MRARRPPLYLLRRFPAGASSPATVLRRYYAAEAWRARSGAARLELLAAIARRARADLRQLVRCTRDHASAARAATGRSVVRQVADQLRIGLLHGVSPKEYYAFELYRDERRSVAEDYLGWHETNGDLVRALEHRSGRTRPGPSTDKEAFMRECRAAGLAVVPILAIATRDGFRCPVGAWEGGDPPAALLRRDLFCKPRASSIVSLDPDADGSAQRWIHLGDDRHAGRSGEVLRTDELVQRLRRLGARGEYLLQPRLANHPALADLGNGALSSITIQTFLDEHDRPEVVAAVFHMAVGANDVADNSSLGGLVAAIDVATGRVGSATGGGAGAGAARYDVHPDGGGCITGRVLPLWKEAVDLARRAHAAFPDRLVVGWDMALTADGPMLIEGDARGFVARKQRAYGRPFGTTRYGRLFAHHVGRLRRAADPVPARVAAVSPNAVGTRYS